MENKMNKWRNFVFKEVPDEKEFQKLTDMKLAEYNPRTHGKTFMRHLEKSLSRLEQYTEGKAENAT